MSYGVGCSKLLHCVDRIKLDLLKDDTILPHPHCACGAAWEGLCLFGQCWAGRQRDSPAQLSPLISPSALPVGLCVLTLPWEGQPSPRAGSLQLPHKQPCCRHVTPRDCTVGCWLCSPEFAWAVHVCLDGVHCIFWSVRSTPHLHR